MDQHADDNNNNDDDDSAVLPDDRRGGGGGGGGGAGDDTYCSNHPYRTNLGGGICAFCLQEKLGKLVSSSSSSSFPLPVRPSPSSPGSDSSSPTGSSPPSSDLSFSASSKPSNLDPNRYNCNRNVHTRRAKIPGFLYSKKKKNKKCTPSSTLSDRAAEFASFKRSNTAPRRPGHLGGFLDGDHGDVLEYSSRKKGFWSFLYLSASSQSSSSSTAATSRHYNGAPSATLPSSSTVVMPGRRAERMTPFSDGSKRCADVIPEDDDVDCSNGNSNCERKVSRSRSVGCGSRSFSGDFFERISTGFGDCTLRRVESQREPNGHGHSHSHRLSHSKHRASSANPEYCMKERVRCGGIFGGFMMASSSSSSSSSSYWITATSSEDHRHNGANGVRHSVTAGDVIHGRNRSWGWAFASPMRAFSRPSTKDGKSGKRSTATPNLNAIPSLLAVGG